MPNRDYAARRKSRTGGNKLLIILIILFILGICGIGLLLLQNTGSTGRSIPPPPKVSQSKSSLPSRPEETYSYIRDLETREVPIGNNSKYFQLTKEQEQQILKQQQLEQQKQEKAKAQAIQPMVAENSEDVSHKNMELKKQQELAKQEELHQKEQIKAEQNKISSQKTITTAKPSSDTTKQVSNKYGLQCGAFKSKAQAENMQARLAMAGYNARINSSSNWNRVVVGPIGDRAAASAALSNARSVAECLIIGM